MPTTIREEPKSSPTPLLPAAREGMNIAPPRDSLGANDPSSSRAEERWTVSPYLTELPPNLWRMAYGRIGDRSIRRQLRADRAHHRLVFDQLNACFAAVSTKEFQLLRQFGEPPRPFEIPSGSDGDAVRRLIAMELILSEQEAFHRHRYDHVGIEINSHCNFRCGFCPVAQDPLPKQLMAPDLIETVIARVAEYGIKSIDLNHYGEPTLSPHLLHSVRTAATAGLRVHLFTNASGLTAEISAELAALGNVAAFVNLPSLDSAEFQKLTLSKQHARVMSHVRTAVANGLPTWLSINAAANRTEKEKRRLRTRLMKETGANAYFSRMISRAGSLKETSYATAPRHEGRLAGCLAFLQKLVVSVEGEVFLCCNDYKREYVLGNLRESSLREIVSRPRAVELRRFIFGIDDAPPDFICRQCEETRDRDEKTLVGPVIEGEPHDPDLGEFRSNIRIRNLLARLPIRLGPDQSWQPSNVQPSLSMPGTRFR